MPRGYEVERIFVKKEPAALAGCIALDERGRDMTTRQFAALLGKERTFVIGGPDGLSDKLKSNAEELVRISSLTLPHALAQVVLLEQIYRAATLLTGHPYHRE
jgi:23S rRNA (pseudouridine1915-N3)-methyltransferase